jgi:Rrf2 family protein
MRFSTKTRYGIRALLEIAAADTNVGVFQKDISQRQEISNKYLDHIIQALKVAGLICNIKGKKSGYILTKPSSEITLYDVHNAFEPGICVVDCMAKTFNCHREPNCKIRGFWDGLNTTIINYLKDVTVKDVIDNKYVIENSI